MFSCYLISERGCIYGTGSENSRSSTPHVSSHTDLSHSTRYFASLSSDRHIYYQNRNLVQNLECFQMDKLLFLCKEADDRSKWLHTRHLVICVRVYRRRMGAETKVQEDKSTKIAGQFYYLAVTREKLTHHQCHQ